MAVSLASKNMKPKFYPLLLRCIEEGAQIGYFRAFKHDDKPSEEIMVERIVDAITNEIYEAFDVDTDANFGPDCVYKL